jgi:ABC-2 type transport system ATP-binding protein
MTRTAAPPIAPALAVADLKKSFAGQTALDGVTLELRPGEILGLLGPNGAGKSTLVRAVAGRVIPDSGEIRIFGRAAAPRDQDARKTIGYVPQDLALYLTLTSRENLALFAEFQGVPRAGRDAAIDAGLRWAALEGRADEPVANLSGGMKRRLNMAIGTVHKPSILLLDEPTVGIDPQSRERIYAMIDELRHSGASIVYTTHYMEEAERLCDRIAVIDHGRLIALGTRDELVTQTLGGARKITIECVDDPPAALVAELARLAATVDGRTIVLVTADPVRDVRQAMDLLEKRGMQITDLLSHAPNLEAVFLALTGRDLRE